MSEREAKLEELIRDFWGWADHKCMFRGRCTCGLVLLINRARALLEAPSAIPETWVLADVHYLDANLSLAVYGVDQSWKTVLVANDKPEFLGTYTQDDTLAVEALVSAAHDLLVDVSRDLSKVIRARLHAIIDPRKNPRKTPR